MQHDFGYMWTVKMLNSGQLSEAVGRGGGGDGERLITGQISLKTQDDSLYSRMTTANNHASAFQNKSKYKIVPGMIGKTTTVSLIQSFTM